MIEIKNLSIQNKDKCILRAVDLLIKDGEKIAILGASGAGKSTLSQAILGEIEEGLTVTSGSIKVNGQYVLKDARLVRLKDLMQIRREIGHLHQDPESALTPTMNVKNLLYELCADKKNFMKDTKALLEKFSLPLERSFLTKYPRHLSGGQRRRLALIRILLRKPKLLLLDEPTNGLDEKIAGELVSYLKILIAELKATVILISHDKKTARELCETYFELTNALLKAMQLDKNNTSGEFVEKSIKDAKKVLEVQNLYAKAPHLKEATVKNLSFTLYEGEILGLVGPSGIGKSTVAKTLLGLWEKESGKIIFTNQATGVRNCEKIGYVPQDPQSSFNPVIKLGKAFLRITKNEVKINEVLAILGITFNNIKNKYPAQLSGGELQRLALGRSLLEETKVIILDEITSSLDEKTTNEIAKLILGIRDKHSILLISHDMELVKKTCNRVIDLSLVWGSL